MLSVLSRSLCSLTDSTRSNITKIIKDKSPVIAGLLIFGLMFLLGIYRCPLEFFVGIPCPLCGITRAFMALAKGDVALAFYYHPLWPLAPFAFGFYMLYYLEIIHPGRKVFNAVTYGLCVLLLACYIIRHIMHSPVVEIDFASSFIGRSLSFIMSLFGS